MTTEIKAMSLNEMAIRAAAFADRWKDFTSEESGDQLFWQDFLNVYGIDVKSVGFFQQKAIRGSTGGLGKIDLFWPGVLIAEQKSAGKSLEEAEIQALDYLDQVNQRQMPGVVVTSDFARIRVLHLDQPGSSAIEFPTANFPKEFERFAYLVGYRKFTFEVEVEANVKASELMGKLYDAASSAGYSTHEATILLTRLLFLMFGDDTGLWFRGQFWNFVTNRTQRDATDLGAQLIALFQALDTPGDKRSANLDELIARFPYVNGGLFSERLGVASFSPQMREVLLECMRFDWGAISPAVFGSLFQAVKDKEARRSLG
jgi:hypothetical protein